MKNISYDLGIIFSSIVLLSLSLLTLFSIDPSYFNNQIIFLVFGIFLLVFFSWLPLEILLSFKNIIYLFCIAGLILTFIIGENIRGSTRWINLNFVSLQFSEISKPFFVIILSAVFHEALNRKYKLLKLVLLSLPFIFLIFKQPDLGNVLVYLFITVGILILNKYFKFIFIVLAILIISGPFLFGQLAPYQKNRITTFLNPNIDSQGIGYNAIQSTLSVGSGEIFGKGLGKGTQSRLLYLPERHTDFIFASFAEEFGFIGSIILICSFIYLLIRILKIAEKTNNQVKENICIGIFCLLSIQFFINIGMNIGIIPITGITLPLISYGGSSLISTLICLGIIQRIHIDNRESSLFLIK